MKQNFGATLVEVQMKLQIVEYKLTDLLNGCDRYRYTLELDGRLMLYFGPVDVSIQHDFAIKKLMSHLRLLTNFDIGNYTRINYDKIPGIDKKVIFEQEVSDHFLKDLKIKERIEELEGDFE